MVMTGRKYQAGSGSYRYGLNGQQKSDDVTSGNYTAEFWEYDSRTGRRWNTDPVILTGESPYLVNGGNPIYYTDPLGDFKTKFGAQWNKFWHGGKSVGKNKYDEWYVTRDITGREGKKGNGKDLLDEVVVGTERYYGQGRNKYSTALEALVRDEEIKQDIFLKGEKSMYKIYESEKEAGNAALSYVGLLLPNPVLKSSTVASNAGKGVGLSDDVASTFRFGKYTKTVLEQPTILFRYYDDVNAFASGRYMTNSVSKFKFLDRMTLAIRPKWNNMTYVAEWQFPAGSTLYKGKAAMQFPWIGGKTQYFVTQDILKTATQLK
jgi:hypothetical protein